MTEPKPVQWLIPFSNLKPDRTTSNKLGHNLTCNVDLAGTEVVSVEISGPLEELLAEITKIKPI